MDRGIENVRTNTFLSNKKTVLPGRLRAQNAHSNRLDGRVCGKGRVDVCFESDTGERSLTWPGDLVGGVSLHGKKKRKYGSYGLTTISRLLKITGLFCRI